MLVGQATAIYTTLQQQGLRLVILTNAAVSPTTSPCPATLGQYLMHPTKKNENKRKHGNI